VLSFPSSQSFFSGKFWVKSEGKKSLSPTMEATSCWKINSPQAFLRLNLTIGIIFLVEPTTKFYHFE
jgi:hypothetical protein